MIIGFFILFFATAILGILLYYRSDSNSNKELAEMLTHDLQAFKMEQLDNIKVKGWEANNWNNNFPTYIGNHHCRILLAENFAVIFPVQKVLILPFVRHMNPFILTSNVEELDRSVRTDRVYQPKNFKISNFEQVLEVEFNYSSILRLRIHIAFERLNRTEFNKLKRIINWC